MALLRAELKGEGRLTYHKQDGGQPKAEIVGIYEGIVENNEDLALPRLEAFDPGSMLYCMEDDSIYIKNSQGSWVTLSA
ncbi:MAG: hypothetical protein IIY94_01600 [Oscillospiraceae bacterium]|nr:hypothetical protein [Oscillospiraceae bacterium]